MPHLKRHSFLGLAISLGLFGCSGQAQERPLVAPALSTPYEWRNVEINGGGFVSGLVFHPKQRGLIYARTDIGGAYRWNNATKRWTALTDEFGPGDWNLLGIESIALDPNDANRVYVAAGTYTNEWAGNGAMLRSVDQGQTWHRSDLPFKNGGNEDGRGMGERLVVHPRDGKTLFFGSRRNGLWKSGDSGATWNKVASFPAQGDENAIGISFLTFDAKGALFAGVASKTANLLQSNDGGATWQAVDGAPQGFFPHHGTFASDGTLYLTYSNGPGPNGVSDGAVWKRSASNKWTQISPIAPEGFGYAGLGVDARDPQVLMVATLDRWAKGDDIFRSVDGGATWKGVKANSKRDASAAPYLKWGRSEADLGHWIADVEIDPFDSSHALYVTGATIWGSNDANALDQNKISNWTVRAGGLEETSVSKLISPPVGPHLISGVRDIGGFVHDDLTIAPRGGSHDNPHTSRTEGIDFAEGKPTLIVRTGDNRGGYSLDSGRTWTEFPGKPAENMEQGQISVSADGASWVWPANTWQSKDGATYFSRDMAATWTLSAGLPAKASVASDRVAPGVFYSLDGAAKQLLVSTDGGATFSPRGAHTPDGFGRLAVSPHSAGDLWMLGPAGLMRSLDGGHTWTKIAGVASADGVGFGKAAPGIAYPTLFLMGTVGGVRGLFRSLDEGANWTRINDDKHQWGFAGQVLTGDPRVFGRVFVATNGRGIMWGEPAPVAK